MIGQPWSNFRYALNTASTWRRFFTSQDLSRFTGQSINDEALRNVVRRDSRFIWLGSSEGYENYFVARSTLFGWFSALNLRLAANPMPLSTSELARSISLYCRGARWECLPPKVARFGRRFGLCVPVRTGARYVFPLAHVLSSIGDKKMAASILESLADDRNRCRALHEPLQGWVDDAISRLTRRQAAVVKEREGIVGSKPKTLGEIGDSWNVTRERVRQIEGKAWERLDSPGPKRLLVSALLCDIIKRQGSLCVRMDSPDEPWRAFIAKCVEVPRAEFPKLGMAVLGWSSKSLPDPSSLVPFPESLDADVVADRLETDWVPSLPGDDFRMVAERLTALSRRRLGPSKRVYLALRHIGKPAHFSVIAEVHNSLFPDHHSNENAVHNLLCSEQHGVVWIGTKGTYALRDWGYERPSAPLFEQVAEIVAEFYEATGKPVPRTTIAGEMGKLRSVVHPSSLAFATDANPRVLKMPGDCFVPKNAADESETDVDSDELDRILSDFEARDS